MWFGSTYLILKNPYILLAVMDLQTLIHFPGAHPSYAEKADAADARTD
jgi:hypothetical protein